MDGSISPLSYFWTVRRVLLSRLASSVWLSEKIKYNENTLKTLADNYYASSFSGTMGSSEYNKMLQDWLNEQTGGLLEEQAGNVEMDPITVFGLATTVYFRAKWQNEFYAQNNTEDVFYAMVKPEDVPEIF